MLRAPGKLPSKAGQRSAYLLRTLIRGTFFLMALYFLADLLRTPPRRAAQPPSPPAFSRSAFAREAPRAAAAAPASPLLPPAADASARADHLLAALAALLPNRTNVDALAVERMIDVLLHAGALPSNWGPRYAARAGALRLPVRVVQVGANDGVSDNDPLWHRINVTVAAGATLEAVLVEPVPHLFAKLSHAYAPWKPSVTPVWGAACGRDSPPGSTVPFIGFRENASAYEYFHQRTNQRMFFPEAYQQLGSFKKGFLMHLCGASEEDIDRATVVYQVPCVSLRSIMCGKGWTVGTVDYLHVDAEGFDDQVVFAAEVELTRPLVVRLEAQHIDGPTVVKHLEERGYRVMHMRAHGVAEIVGIYVRGDDAEPLKCAAA